MIWQNCTMSTIYYGKDAADEAWPCVVKITDDEILVEYDDDGVVQYLGKNNLNGHFELRSDAVSGKATLHMFPGSMVLEGSWIEDGERGMWRINLA